MVLYLEMGDLSFWIICSRKISNILMLVSGAVLTANLLSQYHRNTSVDTWGICCSSYQQIEPYTQKQT